MQNDSNVIGYELLSWSYLSVEVKQIKGVHTHLNLDLRCIHILKYTHKLMKTFKGEYHENRTFSI